MTSTITPVSPDRVVAAALRLSLLPIVDHHDAVCEVIALARGQGPALVGALERLRDDARSGGRGVVVRDAEQLLDDAVRFVGVPTSRTERHIAVA